MQTAYQRLFFVFLIPLITVGQLMAQPPADVRQVRWGFSPKQVKQAETLKPSSVKGDKIVYSRVPLASRTVGLEYDFNGDSLLSATYYYYTTPSITEADVQAASSELEALLKEKYGSGKAAQVGELRTITWLTPRTQIRLALGNVDRGWSLEISYLCRVCSGEPKTGAQPKEVWKARKDIKDL